jgi:hypothetical protein
MNIIKHMLGSLGKQIYLVFLKLMNGLNFIFKY